MYRGWRKNDSWAIRVGYKWKFDIVLQSLRRIQYICMNIDAIQTWFAWRDYHFLIQILTRPCLEVDGKMIRGRFGWGIIESLTLTIYLHEFEAIKTIFAWRDYHFFNSNLDVTMYRGWRKNYSWAIRVRYNSKFDIVLQNLRRIQYICMNIDAIQTWFAWRDYHFLIQIWTRPCLEVDGKMIRGRFGWGIIESLTLFFKDCVVYNISAWIMRR